MDDTLDTSEKPERRLGNFRIAAEYVKTDWRSLLQFFDKVVVVRCEFVFADQSFHYTAFSELFEALEEGAEPPDYEVIIEQHQKNGQPDGERWFSFGMRKLE